MRRLLQFVLFASLIGDGAMAEEPPHLAFVRALRARGMPDLALEYLKKLGEKPPPDLVGVLPLELAKTRLELAAAKPDPGSRAAEQNLARAELEQFVKKNPNHPLAADASLEIARIVASQGRAQLGRARRQEAKPAMLADLGRARVQFEEAAKQLQAAAGQIDAQLTTAQAEADKQALAQSKLQAQLEQGINLIESAQTYTEQAEAPKRGELIKKAIETLDKVARFDPKNPLCWQALAWLGRCYQENDDPKAARKIYAQVIAEPGEAAETGKRLARYYRMQTLANDPDLKKPAAEIQKAGEEWLQLYPNALDTPEGCGVRFELAKAYVQQALASPKASPRSRDMFEQAKKLYQALEQTENDYTTQAHDNKLNIILQVSQDRTRGDISKLRDFEECYLRAQLEVARMSEEQKPAARLSEAQREKLRKQHYQSMLDALTRGLDLVEGKTPPEDVNDARYLLAYVYLTTGDYYRAAVEGEDLARTEVRSTRAPMAGAYALRSYALLLARQEEAGASKEELEPDRARLRNLAGYIEQTWPNDSAADIARHLVGMTYLGDKNYPLAVEVLERVTPAYTDYTRALYQLAAAALEAEKEGMKPPPGKAGFQDRAVQALLKVPELSSSPDSATAHDYFGAKTLLADIYYRTKQYAQMEALAEGLAKILEGLDDKLKAENRLNVQLQVLYAKFGRAEADYVAGQYLRTREVLDPFINTAKDAAQAAQFDELKEKNAPLVRALLSLAMRANVQDNKADRGLEILELLQKAFPENTAEILVTLVQQLNQQIQQLRKQGEPAKAQLDKTVASFSTFLDVLTKQQEKNPKPQLLLFVAQSYSSLGNHSKAADLVNQIQEPKPGADGKAPDPSQLQLYHAARLLFAKELRLNREYDKAERELLEIQKSAWGKQNLEARKEQICLLEDQDKYAGKQGAIVEWDKLMRSLKPRIQDTKVKEQYFDCYYHLAYCIYKNALSSPDPKKRAQGIRVAATYITKLEVQPDPAVEPTKKRFEELLETEPPLKEVCELLRKDAR